MSRQGLGRVIAPPTRTAHSVVAPRLLTDEWWRCCESDSSAAYFATPDWTDILAEAFPHFAPSPRFFSFDEGVTCVLPAIEVRRLFGRLTALHSMPFGTYGGIVSRRTLVPEETAEVVGALREESSTRFQTTAFPNPLGAPLPAAVTTHTDHVYAPDLSHGWQAWWSALEPRTRYHTNKAERRGVEVRYGMDADAFEEFYRLFRGTARGRDGASVFGRRFFRALWDRRSSRTQLWSAHQGGRMVAGVLVLRLGSHVTPYLSAVHVDARALAPTNLLYARLLLHACEAGWTQVSFLGTGGRKGVERFKKSMGGERREFHYLNVARPLYRIIGNPAVRWLRRSGKRMAEAIVPVGRLRLTPAEVPNSGGFAE
jgi:CelD/BcsL family acetyltransferase involved in cellulose biosynthesis